MRTALRSRHLRSRGFSLVEVIVALVLLTVGALGVASLSTSAARLVARGRAIERWTTQLTAVLDSLRAQPCAALTGGSVTSPTVTIGWHVTLTPRVAQLAVFASPPPPVPPLHLDVLHPCE